MDQQDALGVEQITKLKKYPSNSIIDLENYLIKTYQKYIILQEKGKEIYRCFILSFHKEFNRYWISCFLSKPPKKVLIFDDKNILDLIQLFFVFLYKYTYTSVCMFDTTRCKTTVAPTLLHSFTRFYPLFLRAGSLKIARISNTLYNTRN